MGAGRGCFIIFFPILFSLAAIAVTLVTFLSSYEHAGGLKNLYFLRLDFSGINADGINLSSVASSLGVAQIYQIGANGFCYGTKANDGSVSLEGCKTPTTPFWFDIVGLASDTSYSLATIFKTIDLPSEISQYETILRDASYTMWSCYIATMGLLLIQVVIGFFSFRSRGCSFFSSVLSVLSFLTSIVASGIANGMYTVYRNKFNDLLGKFGVAASIGSSGLAISWVSTAIALLAGLAWFISICVGSTRHKHTRLPNIEDDEKAFIGYVPHH